MIAAAAPITPVASIASVVPAAPRGPTALPAAAVLDRSGTFVELLGELPDPVAVFFVFVTQLGDVWWLFSLVGAAYLAAGAIEAIDRPRAAFLVGIAVSGAALTVTLKHAIALPRPPGATTAPGLQLLPLAFRPLYERLATSGGYGFPSGHATLGAAVYWGGALVTDYRTRPWRVGVATVVVALVSLSRVVIGVHYLADVLAGLLLGGVLVVVAYHLGARGARPGRILSLAVAVSLLGVAVVFATDTIVTLGAALGARLSWGIAGDRVLDPVRSEAAIATVVGLPAAGALFGVAYAATSPPAVVFLASAAGLGMLFTAPLAARQLDAAT